MGLFSSINRRGLVRLLVSSQAPRDTLASEEQGSLRVAFNIERLDGLIFGL